MQIKYKITAEILSMLVCSLIIPACKKQLQVDIPAYTTNTSIIYNKDATAATVLTGIYMNLSQSNLWRLPVITGLTSDELTLDMSVTDPELIAFYKYDLSSTNVSSGSPNDLWYVLYPNIYYANAAIEGLTASTSLSDAGKKQLLGEAKFIRAFCYFHLVNLYGDVPIALTTDYKVNSLLHKSSKETVWGQIIADLLDAQSLLSSDFRDGSALAASAERLRPSKWAATALLARAYLYTSKYADAELQATSIINNTSLFKLSALNETFLATSSEAIWQLQSTMEGINTFDAPFFVIPESGPGDAFPVYLSDTLLNSFEAGDLRKIDWIGNVTVDGKTYYFPFKYKVSEYGSPLAEYYTLFRLGEQYLIRAEARINQSGKIADGIADLNVLRQRARVTATDSFPNPLPALSTNLSNEAALNAVSHERQIELFTEAGHRWFDLKRTGKADVLMPSVAVKKGATWNTNWQLYPIPLTELQKAPNLKQNQGYN